MGESPTLSWPIAKNEVKRSRMREGCVNRSHDSMCNNCLKGKADQGEWTQNREAFVVEGLAL